MQFLKTETVLINFNNYKYNFLAQLLKYSNDKWLLKRMNLNERKLKSWKFFEQVENTKDHAIKKSILLYNSYHWNSYTCYITWQCWKQLLHFSWRKFSLVKHQCIRQRNSSTVEARVSCWNTRYTFNKGLTGNDN